jgi:hypothetical protein
MDYLSKSLLKLTNYHPAKAERKTAVLHFIFLEAHLKG